MDMRELKALELAARAKIVFVDGVWRVPSQSSATFYRVSIDEPPSCECEDFQLRQKACKHVLAARLVCARDGKGTAPAIVTDVVPKRPTYKQVWPLYNVAQQTEKDRFQKLLFDLLRNVEEPPQPWTGRKRTLMADMIFASCLKVFVTFSSRRFSCDLADAHEQGYLTRLMNSMSVCSYLENELMTPVLEKLIVQSSLPLKSIETVFAPDSTGFSTSRFIRWYDEKYGTAKRSKAWVKAHAIFGVKTNVATAVQIDGQDAADCPFFKPLVEKTAENFKVEKVTADKGYVSHENLELLEQMGGTAYIPFKSNSTAGEPGSLWEKMFLYYNFRREEFLRHYHARSNAESGFSMIKAKFRDHVRSKIDVAMKNEVLCKFLCHNICVVHQSHIELGIEPVFWGEQRKAEAPSILAFPACNKTS